MSSLYRPELLEGWAVLDPRPGHVGPRGEGVIGVYGKDQNSIGFDDAHLGRHVLFLGGIGTGKTVGMSALVASIRDQAGPDDVFVFFDTKGDYIDRFFREGDVSISAGDLTDFSGGVTWNIFREIGRPPAPELLDRVTEVVAPLIDPPSTGADNNRIWVAMAQDLLSALITALIRTGKDYSNADVRAIADKMSVATMRSILEKHGDLRGVLQYIAKDQSNVTISVLIFLQQAVRATFAGNFRSRGEFSVRDFVRGKGGRALFLEYDVARGSLLTPVYRTLLDAALREALGRQRAAGRVFLVLDEFSLLPRLRHIDAGLNFGRSLGLRFVVGTQNVGQVIEAYGPGLSGSILSGFGTVFSFRLYDAASRQFVRERYGANRKLVRYDAAVRTRGVGEQLLDGSVIEDWDLTNLAVGEAIVAFPDAQPLRFRFAEPAS